MADKYKPGDIVNINLGNPPQEVKGHEQGYERPCVIIRSLERLGLLIILPITGTEPTYSLFTMVELSAGTAGLTKISYVLCHQIRTVSLSRVNSRRGTISSRELNKIISVLKDTLEL